MASLDSDFADYLLEKEGKLTTQTEEGFYVWKYLPHSNEFWVCFIYIKPEHRCGKAFRKMMEQITDLALGIGAKQIIADVDYRNNGSEHSLQIFFKMGMKIGDIRDNRTIWLYHPLLANPLIDSTIINNKDTEVSNG